MKRTYLFIALCMAIFVAFIIVPDRASAQPPPPPSKPAQNPVDGGLFLLVVAGGGYAIKKLRDQEE